MITNVLIVDADAELIGRSSQAVLSEPDLRLGAVASSGSVALALMEVQVPDIVLIDLDLDLDSSDIDAVEVIRHATRRHPACLSLAFAQADDCRRIRASMEAGASGWLLKDADPGQIIDAIRAMRAGGCPVSPRIARQIIKTLQGAASVPAPEAAESPLTLRESEVLRLAAKGLGFEKISDLLEISTHTVTTHVRKIYRKLSVHSRAEAVYEARQMGWL